MMNTNWFEKRTRTYHILSPYFLKKIIVLLRLCLLFGIVCAFRTVNSPILLTRVDDGKTVIVPSDTHVIIKLPTNSGSTGSTWSFTQSGNQNLLLQNTMYLPPHGRPMPGAPGTLVFAFMTKKSGSTHLQFVLQRSWETTLPPIQRFTGTLQVHP